MGSILADNEYGLCSGQLDRTIGTDVVVGECRKMVEIVLTLFSVWMYHPEYNGAMFLYKIVEPTLLRM